MYTVTHSAVCDRCGRREVGVGLLFTWDSVEVRPMIQPETGAISHDLCSSCAQELASWLKTPPVKEEPLAEWERELLLAQEEPTGWSDEPCAPCAQGEHGSTDTDGVEVWCMCCSAVIAP